MAQNNSSLLSDVSSCLRDALDSMFSNGNNMIIPPETNPVNTNASPNNGSLSAEELKSIINKRKLVSTMMMNGDEIYQNDSTKRLCTMHGQ